MQRLKGLRGREPEIPSSVDSTESDDAVQRVPAGFVALATSENSSRDSSADEHVNVGKLEKDEDERNQVQLPVSAQSGHRDKSSAARCAGTARKLSRNKKSRTSKEEDSDFQVLESQQSAHACDFVDGLASAEVLADVVVLAMRRADFSVENERRRGGWSTWRWCGEQMAEGCGRLVVSVRVQRTTDASFWWFQEVMRTGLVQMTSLRCNLFMTVRANSSSISWRRRLP